MIDKAAKTAFLVRYSQMKERVRLLNERKKVYESDIYGIKATTISDMPKGTSSADMGDKVIKFISLTEDIDNEMQDLWKKMEYIRKAIKRLKNARYLSVIEMKYVDGLQRKQIAGIVGVEVLQIDRICNAAIKVLPLTDEDIDFIL